MPNDFRVIFNGVPYRLVSLDRVNTKYMTPYIPTLEHLGSVSKQELHGGTLQVYREILVKKKYDGSPDDILGIRLFAARANQSNYINEVYMMEAHDYVPVPVPSF